ncbi:MAG: nuclear transport factor 2 family protein [Pyrinomonadaceae bacterium]
MLGKEPLTLANDSETRETDQTLPIPQFDDDAIKHARPAVPLAKVETTRSWPTKVLIIAAVLAALIGGAVGRSLPALFHKDVETPPQAAQTETSKGPVLNTQDDTSSEMPVSEAQKASNKTSVPTAQNQPAPAQAESSNKQLASVENKNEKRAEADSTQSVAPDGDTEASLRDALKGWVTATNERDINKQMSFYPQTLKAFYLSRNASREDVRAEKARVFSHAESVDIRAGAPDIKVSPDGRTATMRFRKRYQIAGGGEDRAGEVLQELRWQKVGGKWRITSERDLRIVQ